MPNIAFGMVKYTSRYESNDLSFKDRYDIPVTGKPGPKLLRLVRQVIEAVMRVYTERSIHAYVDSRWPYTVLLRTSAKLDWTKFVKPCLDDALGAFEALRIFGLTEGQFAKLVNGLGKGKDPNLFALLLRPPDRRIEFRRDFQGHASVVVYAEKPDNALVKHLITWVLELSRIGAYDAIFALLDKLDLSMVGEFHELTGRKLPPWQEMLVDCYRHLTGASLRELAKRRWINFDDLITDLKTELIIGLCEAKSGYYDPVMAAKVMLRQARANPYSGELATGDMVIEALIATGIPRDRLEQALGRQSGSSEAHWWGKLESRLKDPDEVVIRDKRNEAPERLLPRFSLQHNGGQERMIRLHNVAPNSPIKGVIDYILQGLVKADSPESGTKVRALEFEEKFLISFSHDNVVQTSAAATLRAESMFGSFANFGIPEVSVADFFAGHREIETPDLFSHGLAKLLATPDKSGFGIATFYDHFEVVDKGIKDDEQRLERAQHLSETIADLVWFGLPAVAKTLVPLLRSDLQSLWQGEPLDWDKLVLPDLRDVLQILLESRSSPLTLQEGDELVPQEHHVWRNGIIR